MATSRRYGRTLGVVLGGFALQAVAEPPAASADDNGLMAFPNVRVVNAPAPAQAATELQSEQGMRAYMANGQLVEQPANAAEAAQLAPTQATRTRLTTNSVKNTTDSAASSPQIVYGPDNSMSIMLDDSFMVFQTAHKDADGKLTQQCITGEDSATHAVHAVDVPVQEESANDR